MIEQKLTKDVELNPKEAAEFLGCSVGLLANDRIGKRRIPFVKVMGKIRYRLSDLEAMKVYHKAAA
jgi:hypothetical protein